MKTLTMIHDEVLEKKNHSLLTKQTGYAFMFLIACSYLLFFLFTCLKLNCEWLAFVIVIVMFLPMFVVLLFGPFPKFKTVTQQEIRASVIHKNRFN
jgi:hypothetical protein